MKKAVKISLYVLGGFIGLLILAGILVPIIFKDDIKKAIDDTIAENVNAKIEFDISDFNISLFSNFPNLTVSMDNLAVIGIDEFKGDTLASFESFSVALDLMEVLSGDQMEINGIYLDSAKILGKVTKEGKANWDIVKPTDEEQVEEEDSEPFNLEIEEIIITNGEVVYDDQQGDMFAEILALNFDANIKLGEVMMVRTNTEINSLSYEMEGISYLYKGKFNSKVDMNADFDKGRYEFLENELRLNDFGFGFDGVIGVTDEATSFENFTFGAKDTKFKSILSLVPGVFLEGFEDLKTSGTFSFKGDANGSLSDTSYPSFNLGLSVKDGFLQYPDLPSSIKDITVDLGVNNPESKLQSTVVDLKQFSFDLAGNPFSASMLLKFLNEELSLYDLKAKANMKLDLAKLLQVVPVDGLAMKGLFKLQADISGIMSEENMAEKIPRVDVDMSLTNGFAESKEVPVPIKDMHFTSSVHIPEDNLNGGEFLLNDFTVSVAEEKFVANAEASEFNDAKFKGDLSGILDLDKILKIFPIEDMEMGGKFIVSEFFVDGRMSDIENEDYGKIKLGGGLDIENFTFKSEDLPQGITIKESKTTMTPDKINIESYDGLIGKSQVYVKGYLKNYMGYGLGLEDSTIIGDFDFSSPSFDVNEWMTEEEETTTVEVEDEEPLEIIPIPRNIDFVMHSSLDKVIYDNMDINDLKGDIIVKDGAVKMKKVDFNMLGGQFKMNGTYDTKDIEHPKFDYDMIIDGMAIKDAYATFNTVKVLAPITKGMSGKFSTDFKINGELGQDMMPLYNTLNGGGIFDINKAAVKDLEVFEKIGKTLKLKNFDGFALDKALIDATIEDGTVALKPFDAKAGDVDMKISGKNSFEGDIDYLFDMAIPSGAAGSAATSALSNAGISGIDVADNIPVMLGLTGTYDNPKPKILGKGSSKASNSVKTQAKEVVQKEVIDVAKKETFDEYNKQLEEQAANVIKESKKQATSVRKEGESAAEKLKKEGYAQAKALENQGGNMFAKKANEIAADKLRDETDKKAKQVKAEADKKAKQVEAEGRKKAESILSKKK